MACHRSQSRFGDISSHLLIIRDPDIQRIGSLPTESNAPPAVNVKAPKSSQLTAQLLQSVAGRDGQKIQCRRRIDLVEQTPSLDMQLTGRPSGIAAVESVVDILIHFVRHAPWHLPLISYRYTSKLAKIPAPLRGADPGAPALALRSNRRIRCAAPGLPHDTVDMPQPHIWAFCCCQSFSGAHGICAITCPGWCDSLSTALPLHSSDGRILVILITLKCRGLAQRGRLHRARPRRNVTTPTTAPRIRAGQGAV
jgi:hypothetical protein